MPKATRIWHLTAAAICLAVALSFCTLIAGGVFSALKEPVMWLWLFFSWAMLYVVVTGLSGRFAEAGLLLGVNRVAQGDEQAHTREDSQDIGRLDQRDAVADATEAECPALSINLSSPVEIGQVFYHNGREDSLLKPGILSFQNGVLCFRGDTELEVDMAAGMQQLGDSYLCVIDDDVYDNPVLGKRDPVRVVRVLCSQNLYEPAATFLMPMEPAKLTEAVMREYVEHRTADLEQTRSLLLDSVAEVVGQWVEHPKVATIIEAFLLKADTKPFTDPACLMSFELRLRCKLLDGHLGNPLLWTSAFESQWLDRGRTGSLDLLPAAARAFYYDSFRFLVRLLQRDCPLERSYPELVNSLTVWLLLREAAVRYFAGLLEAKLADASTETLKAVVAAYVGHYAEDETMQDENLSQLAYLLVSKGLLTAPAVFGDLGYHEEHNILLLLDAIKAHVTDALEEKRLDRFAERLFVER